MGISIKVNNKQDYSYLFKGMSGNAVANLNFLSDYASIKNGSYGKLMKAYYSKNASKEVSSLAQTNKKTTVSTAKDSSKTLTAVEKAADGLKESADKLITKGTNSLFNKVDIESKDSNGISVTTKDYDKEAIGKAVSDFVSDYNQLLKDASGTKTDAIQSRTKTLMGMTDANADLLSKVGITVNKDHTMTLDQDKLKSADIAVTKSLFNGNSSYAYRVSAQASLIDFAAEYESTKGNTYTAGGGYSSAYNAGGIFDSGF